MVNKTEIIDIDNILYENPQMTLYNIFSKRFFYR